MNYNKESLSKLLLLIDEIGAKPENSWFKEVLTQKFGGASGSSFDDFPTFLMHLKKNYKLKATEFYKNIHDKKLKKELVKDNVEMQWYQATHDVERFLLFTFYQVENLLNYYCIKADAYDKIEKDKNRYQHSFGFTVICYDNFFNKNSGSTIPIEKVNPIYAKIAFWLVNSTRTGWYKSYSNSYNMSDLIKTRNLISHRSSTSEPDANILKRIESLRRKDFSSLSFYINILKEIVKSIAELSDNSVTIHPAEVVHSQKTRLKIVGKIDL